MAKIELAKPVYSVLPEHDIFKIHSKQSKAKKIALNIISTFIFPMGIARIIRYGIGKLTGKVILPAQINCKKQELDQVRRTGLNLIKMHDLKADRLTIKTADQVQLDTLKILNPNQNKSPDNQKWIVLFCPQFMPYEKLIPFATKLSLDTGVNIYLGNFRGFGYSKGAPSCAKDLVLDGEAMIQYLHSHEKIPYSNIFVQGWSVTGAVATEVVARHQQKNEELKLCNDRSFSSLFKEIKCFLPSAGIICASMAYLIGWKFNSINSWNSISDKNKMILYQKEDDNIPYKASLYKAAKNSENRTARPKYKPQNAIEIESKCNLMLTLENYEGYKDYLNLMKKLFLQ